MAFVVEWQSQTVRRSARLAFMARESRARKGVEWHWRKVSQRLASETETVKASRPTHGEKYGDPKRKHAARDP